MKINIYQIFYDENTRRLVPEGCIGIDNINPAEPGWFEFYPILNQLRSETIFDDVYYGFLSPNFQLKTGMSVEKLISTIRREGSRFDAFISNYCWDQTAYFKNAWDQGEFWHPGINDSFQRFIDFYGLNINLQDLVGCSKNTVASNYVVATGRYWKIWLDIASKFEKYVHETAQGRKLLEQNVCYASAENLQRMVVFIQERFASFILSTHNFKTHVFDFDVEKIVFDRLFFDSPNNVTSLQVCDQLKEFYIESRDSRFLKAWTNLRAAIRLNLIVRGE